jgi:hypothetical protein
MRLQKVMIEPTVRITAGESHMSSPSMALIHIYLWWLDDSPQLSQAARSMILHCSQ